MARYYRIAVATPLRRLFDYSAPDSESIEPGVRVCVPFSGRRLTGIVIKEIRADELEISPGRIKAIEQVLDSVAIVNSDMLDLYLWIARYYQAPPGEVIIQALPALARKPNPLPEYKTRYWRRVPGSDAEVSFRANARLQQQAWNVFCEFDSVSETKLRQMDIQGATLKALTAKGLIESFEADSAPATRSVSYVEGVTLNVEQKLVADALVDKLTHFNSSLIEGVTGSGKTEVYISVVTEVLRQGKQALILVPEIGLTPQTHQRFESMLNCPVAVYHSGLTDQQRTRIWLEFSQGKIPVILGTRSSVFIPMQNPGIIIVDEEHDASYKQQDGFRYHARDLAVKRASVMDIPVVLGSATPSLESINQCQQHRYQHFELTKRAKNQQRSQVELIDLTRTVITEGISEPVISRMAAHLSRQEQVLLFLNRRGFAPTLMCQHCGWTAGCEHCDARQTLHRSPDRLMCHHCGTQSPIPHQCPSCNCAQLSAIGQGTARTQEFIVSQFPDIPVIRIDRDAVQNAQQFNQLLEPARRGEPCILIGTQMLAKGHDFPDVTLAVVLDADAGLFSSDFRAPEKSAQLLTQVSGRAGRAEKQGHVMIQTWHPSHPVFGYLGLGGYGAFARDQLLPQRKRHQLPPFSAMAMIRADSKSEQQALAFMHQLARQISDELKVTGPFPAILSRRAGQFRFWLSVQHHNRKNLNRCLAELVQKIDASKSWSGISWGVDVDPVDMG